MKRKRTIANLLQESNEPVTPAANLISTLINVHLHIYHACISFKSLNYDYIKSIFVF